MKNLIFLITENPDSQSIINNTLVGTPYKVEIIKKNNLLVNIYNKKPNVILLDVACYSETAIGLIQSALAINYIPTICISRSYKDENKAAHITNSILLPIENIESSLNLLIQQSVHFYNQYTYLAQSYDTMDLMNEEIKKTLDYYVKALPKYENEILSQYINRIFYDNLFLENKPKGLWLIDKGYKNNIATLLLYNNNELTTYATVSFAEQEIFNYNNFIETGYYENFGHQEYSDIDNIFELFPKKLLEKYIPLYNIVSFAVNNLMIIAFDYNNSVSHHEIDTIQSLTIKIDLIKNIKEKMNEVESSFSYTMNALARAAEANDDITGEHIKRVNLFSKLLAEELQMDYDFVRQIETAAQMHDVGKINIDKSILCKPGKLTDEEFEIIQKHTIYGERIIGDSKYLRMAAEIARHHHEKFDGSGYPDGIAGEAIPLSARIVCLADIYDALRCRRTYKPAFSHEKTYNIITKGDGRVEPYHFDPKVLQAFKNIHEQFKTTYEKYSE